MIKVKCDKETYYYDNASDVYDDYPDAEIHDGVAIIEKEVK